MCIKCCDAKPALQVQQQSPQSQTTDRCFSGDRKGHLIQCPWPAQMVSLLLVWGISVCCDNSGHWYGGRYATSGKDIKAGWAIIKPSLAKPTGPGANPLMAAIFGSVASMVT